MHQAPEHRMLLLFVMLLAFLPLGESVPIQCSTQARQLNTSVTRVSCPAGCLSQNRNVWGTDTYTDDSSICRAAAHAGILTDAGGQVTVEKRPGQNSYQGTTRNGITTSSYGAWPGSFVVSRIKVFPIQCSTQARQLSASITQVSCPAGCLSQNIYVWGTDIYTDDSSICRAAGHAGILTDAGGPVTVEKKPGQNSYQGTTRNGITTSSYGAWSGSFVLSRSTSSNVSTPHNSSPPSVPIQCSTQARQLNTSVTRVSCPAGCLSQNRNVWGTDTYTDDSSICRAAAHAGILTDAGGQVTVEKRPGQNSYQGTTRNGITTSSYGAWPGSFVVYRSTSTNAPTTRISSPLSVPIQCSTQARQLNTSVTRVSCPAGCLSQNRNVWGTDTYTDDSSICRAAAHAGLLTDAGGQVTVEKRPGQNSYQGTTRNGITTISYGAWHGSFVVYRSTSTNAPTTRISSPLSVPIQCSTQARQLNTSVTRVSCPAGCLSQNRNVWGTDTYTDDSSICRAAAHAGLLTDAGGQVTVEKRPGQNSYQGTTRNGITTISYGAWHGSFVVYRSTSTNAPTTRISSPLSVPIQCSTQARQLNTSVTRVSCPAGCLSQNRNVWGTDTYTDDSSICRAAAHAGILTDAGGQVIVEKRPGQNSYQGTTRNGITTSSYGAWPGSFVVYRSTSTNAPTTRISSPLSVPIQCSTQARQLNTSVTRVSCPAGCLSQNRNVWGTDTYTDDSSICRAAAHAGILTDAGGQVIVEKRPGQNSYQGTTRNGITTSSYGAWPGSFVVYRSTSTNAPITRILSPLSVVVQCSTQSRQLSTSTTNVSCPAGCLLLDINVWGTGIYTDNSSICRAAIHAGMLTNAGGKVRVVKWPGVIYYQGTSKNGIWTLSHAAWSGSFILHSAAL
ncbi:uncharacterized protein LOC115100013 [Rhinatrema bivittatum]|uniref:uncharacterized protein LOC115100013 n=1 Tax=Rhinatrema bivittatum TaxID=194408 RepID=UPI0011285F5E|nr:uncharacterized protein LOC115100013 [Rhinatrema bivittatum]